MAILFSGGVANGQIPVEFFCGNESSTLDIMFFKHIRKKSGDKSKFLFFNRNRLSVAYNSTITNNAIHFGFTEAVSFNHQKLKGFAPILAGQIISSGVYVKAGFQFVSVKRDLTVISSMVCDLKNPIIDFFFLGKYIPRLTKKINLFSQLELVNSASALDQMKLTLTQRIRLGLEIKAFQFGVGADFTEMGRCTFLLTQNIGAFLRYEF